MGTTVFSNGHCMGTVWALYGHCMGTASLHGFAFSWRPVLTGSSPTRFPTQCRSQRIQMESGNMLYKGSAPIFVTTKLSDLAALEYNAQSNPATGDPWNADASMLMRRLKVYKFTKPIAKPPRFNFCKHCFAKLLQCHAPAWQQ